MIEKYNPRKTLQFQCDESMANDEAKSVTNKYSKAVNEKCYKKLKRCLQITGELSYILLP